MFDLLNLQPNKVSTGLDSYNSFLYALPKAGKSTFAFKSFGQEALFLACENGYGALSGVMAIDITKWGDLVALNKQLKMPEIKAKFKVLVVDTVDIMHKYAVKQICQREGVQALGDIPHGKGYAMVDDLIFDMIKTWENLGYKMFFISHAKEKTEKLPTGGEVQKYIPSVERRTLNIVSKFVDNILFGYLSLDAEGQEVRTIFTRETLSYSAGSRFSKLPSQIPFDAELFKLAWEKAINEELNENPTGFTSEKKNIVIERKVDFNTVMAEIKNLVTEKFMSSNRMDVVTEIGEKYLGVSKRITEATPSQADILDVILSELESKVEELGL